MVIAALATFVILFVAWLVAPSPGRAEHARHTGSMPADLAAEAL